MLGFLRRRRSRERARTTPARKSASGPAGPAPASDEAYAEAPGEAVQSARALGLGPARLEALAREIAETDGWVRMLHGDEAGGPAASR